MKVILEGDFDLLDLCRIAQALRIAERSKPDKIYSMLFDDKQLTMEQATKLVKAVYDSTLEAIG
jgi:hypothetical protein